MINSVELTNFKSFRHQRIDLEPLTVFVGANASGKTSVLEAIHYAVTAINARQAEPHGSAEKVFAHERHCDWLYTRGGTGDLEIACTTAAGTFTVSATPPQDFPFSQPARFGHGQWTFRTWAPEGVAVEDALQPARSLVFLHLDAAKLSDPSYMDRTPPRVEFNGEGLAAVLAYMALNDPDGFDALLGEMKTLIPHLKRIRFTKAPVHRLETEYVRIGDESVERRVRRKFQGDEILFDFVKADNVSARTASEGTLMLLGLLAVLLGPSKPSILLLDDIEHGLHPLAQKSLLDVLGKLMARFPKLQILASSHSPYLLDSLKPEQARLLTISPDGYSVCGRLSDHPQFEKWKDEMAPGELWSLFGEKWIAREAERE